MSEKKRMSTEIMVAWIGCLGTVVTALIGGCVAIVTLVVPMIREQRQANEPLAQQSQLVVVITQMAPAVSAPVQAAITPQARLELTSVAPLPSQNENIVFATPQPIQSGLQDSPELRQWAISLIEQGIYGEIDAHRYLNSAYLRYTTGSARQYIESQLATLSQQGLFSVLEYDAANSFYPNLRVINDAMIEVDACPIYTSYFYSQYDGSYQGSSGTLMFPQTVLLEGFSDGWYITSFTFIQNAVFCQ
jgi:hypothetical protein